MRTDRSASVIAFNGKSSGLSGNIPNASAGDAVLMRETSLRFMFVLRDNTLANLISFVRLITNVATRDTSYGSYF